MFEELNKIVDFINNGNTVNPVLDISSEAERIVRQLLNVPGMTLTNTYDFDKAMPILKLKEGTILKLYINPFGVKHVFLTNNSGKAIFAGFVGWVHSYELDKAIKQICEVFSH
ncbi:MAG: hypothetical protein WBA39_23765 [Rivularia sp. (in: cyanobacteria)]